MSLQAIELNSDDGQRSGHGNFQFCAKRLRYSCRVALCAFFRLCEVPRCGGDHGNSLSSTAAATSPSSTAAWRCLTTPDCAPHSDVRVDSAGTRAIGTTVRSHPQLLNGRLRSTTASCGSTALSKTAPAEVLLAVIRTHHRMHLASIAFCSEALLRDMALLHYRSQDILVCTFSQAPGWALVVLGGGLCLDGGSPPRRHGHRALPIREALDYE